MKPERNWPDRWRQFIGLSPEGYHEIIQVLQTRYVEEMQHVQYYALQAQRMADAQDRDRLLAIAADEARHGEWLAEKIRLLGGTLPALTDLPDKNRRRNLLADFNDEKHGSDALIERMQTVRNELPELAEGLERIFEENERHRAEIRALLKLSNL